MNHKLNKFTEKLIAQAEVSRTEFIKKLAFYKMRHYTGFALRDIVHCKTSEIEKAAFSNWQQRLTKLATVQNQISDSFRVKLESKIFSSVQLLNISR